MPVPKIVPPKIPWFKQYAVIIGGITAGILALTIFIAYNARDELLYPRLSPGQLTADLNKYKNSQIGLQGQFLDFSTVQKPLCIPQGGDLKYPQLRSDYKSLPTSWGIYYDGTEVAVKVINSSGQELDIKPNYQNGQSVELKGIVRLTTTLDDCNIDVAYQSAYLEIKPSQLGIKEE